MIAVGKVVHRLQSLVDNANTCFMSTDRDFLNILHRQPMQLKFGVDLLRSFNSGLRMKFRCSKP